ncbi:hypothetical protein [Paenibacillus caui]|uniref:hypothetical protein n=1 Tax=Paenibacillus caui TaxID=2873927 RepID=UPI001CAA004D|nr:hypothetical protein [Paenibacillus caui]
MNKRATGMMFIGIAAFLYGIRYLAAAIFSSNITSWSTELFHTMLDYIGNGPLVLACISLAIGVIYLLIAEFGTHMQRQMDRVKQNWNENEDDELKKGQPKDE